MLNHVFGRVLKSIRANSAGWVIVFAGWLGIAGAFAELVSTRVQTDMAIDGAGFFVLRSPVDGQQLVTRRGDFRIDQDGYLVDYHDLRLQGYSDATLSSLGDIRIDTAGGVIDPMADSSPKLISYQIGDNGKVQIALSDGSIFVRGQVLLQNFQNPSSLVHERNGSFSWTDTAGPRISLGEPGTGGLGSIRAGNLEYSGPAHLRIRPPGRVINPFSTGLISATGRRTDLTIRGRGFFIVRDPATGETWATRVGAFWLDRKRFLVTQTGLRVQGVRSTAPHGLIDIQVTAYRAPQISDPSLMETFTVAVSGEIQVGLQDGTLFNPSRILLQDFQDPGKLTKEAFSLFGNLVAAGPKYFHGVAGRNGLGRIEQGSLDLDLIDASSLALRRNRREFWQGALSRTGGMTNLAVAGEGFFILRDPVSGERFATRCGTFKLTTDGHLVLNGLRLQGFTNAPGDGFGDLHIDLSNTVPLLADGLGVSRFAIDYDGRITIALNDGTVAEAGTIALQNFRAPDALTIVQTRVLTNAPSVRAKYTCYATPVDAPLGDRIYGGLTDADPEPPGIPTQSGFGKIQAGALELPPAPEGALLIPPNSGTTIVMEPEFAMPRNSAIEVSSDLIHWAELPSVNTISQGGFLTDTTPQSSPNRFYRARFVNYPDRASLVIMPADPCDCGNPQPFGFGTNFFRSLGIGTNSFTPWAIAP